MNPLSPLTYYRRHKRQTLLLVGLVSLMTLGVFASACSSASMRRGA